MVGNKIRPYLKLNKPANDYWDIMQNNNVKLTITKIDKIKLNITQSIWDIILTQ